MSSIAHFRYGLRSFLSNTDILIVVADVIVRAFIMFGGIRSVVRDILKFSDRVWNASVYEKLTFCEKLNAKTWSFVKKRLLYRCFLVNFVKFLRTPIL